MTELVTNEDGFIENPLRRQLAPETFSWRDVEVPIKNQNSCGSCKIISSKFSSNTFKSTPHSKVGPLLVSPASSIVTSVFITSPTPFPSKNSSIVTETVLAAREDGPT